MAHTKVGSEGSLSDRDANGSRQVELESRRASRKRKQGSHGKDAREPKAKTMRTTETGCTESLTAATDAPPPLEPMEVEDFGLLAAESVKKRKNPVSLVQTKDKDEEHIGDAPTQGTTYSSTTDNKSTEVTAATHQIPGALRNEESSKTEQVPALALTDLSTGTHTAPIVTKEPPKRRVVSKLPPNKKMHRLNTVPDEMAINEDGEEMRQKEYLNSPDAKYASRKTRALSQPIYFVDRVRCDTADAPMEKFTIMGSTGVKYTVHFGFAPTCTCPDYLFRQKPCKHIIYVAHKVLKIADPLSYQEAYLSTELHDIFKTAPAAPFADIEEPPEGLKRNPIKGECPICYMEFEEGNEPVSYCKAACGNNVHTPCINAWLESQQKMYRKATCPYCRQDWID